VEGPSSNKKKGGEKEKERGGKGKRKWSLRRKVEKEP